MGHKLTDAREFLHLFVQKLNKEPNSVVLVEGKRDREFLLRLGVMIPVIEISWVNLERLVEELSLLGIETLIVLTDFDEQGNRLLHRLKQLCSLYGLRVNEKYRNELKKLQVSEIEHLSKFLDD